MTLQPVRLAIMAPTLNLCNYLFGIDQGYFAREGLDVEVLVRPGLRNTQAVLDGDADFGAANECVIQLALRGTTPLKIVMQVLNDPLHDLLVGTGINAIADLKGRRIAVPGAGSTPEIQTRLLLKQHGLEPGRDIEVVSQAPQHTMADRIAQFESGEYAALIASPPVPFLLHARGYRTLTELSEHFPGTASHGLIARVETITERRPVVAAMARAYAAGVRALKSDRAAALAFIARRFDLDATLAGRCYDLMRERWTADLSMRSLATECEFHARNAGVAAIAPQSISDASFLPA